jgi:PAS domain S-box-containing protein
VSALDHRLQDFFENAAIALHWVGHDGTILRANKAELDLLGYAAEEYIGRNIADFHADADVIADILRRLAQGETLHSYPARLRCKDGSLRHVEITSNVSRDENGRFLNTRCFSVDVTDRRQIDELTAQTADYLEGLMEGFVAYDGEWRMMYMNAAAERLLKRDRRDVLGKTWHQAFPHAVGNAVDHMYQRVMRERVAQRLEMYYPHYDMWMEIGAAPVKSGGVAVYFSDVSERVRATRALERSAQELRDADRRKDEFLATLAHELRNPLAPIRNGLQLLRLAQPGSEVAEQARAMMERQTKHLVRLVDDLLEVSRITTGKLELRKEPVELAAVLGSAVETSRPLIEAGGHTLSLDLPPEVITVEGDPVRLAQVMANLLNNAAKYTQRNGRIELAVRRDDAEVEIRVCDDGVGIEPAMLAKVFELFTQAGNAPTQSQGGLGIGLTLARTLVELHGGRIDAHSAGAGKGSEFVVRLPVLFTRPTVEKTIAERPGNAVRRRVLVVDDNVDAAESLGMLLRAMGHEAEVAHDGAAAIERARAMRPDLLLLDISMPGLDGLAVASRLRADPGMQGVRIVAITGRGHEDDRRRCREAGFDEHVVKPVAPEKLRDLLEQ